MFFSSQENKMSSIKPKGGPGGPEEIPIFELSSPLRWPSVVEFSSRSISFTLLHSIFVQTCFLFSSLSLMRGGKRRGERGLWDKLKNLSFFQKKSPQRSFFLF